VVERGNEVRRRGGVGTGGNGEKVLHVKEERRASSRKEVGTFVHVGVGVDMVIERKERLFLCVKGRRRGGERPILRRGVKGEGGERREQGAQSHCKKEAARSNDSTTLTKTTID